MRRLVVTSVFLSALMVPYFTMAHTDEYLATVEAPHGGQLRAAGPFHLELVAQDGELKLYITDHGDKPIPARGGQGKANILEGKDGKRQSVTLEPVFANMMRAKGDFKITSDTAVAVFVAIPGYETQGARFVPQGAKGSDSDCHDQSDDHDHHDEDEDKDDSHSHGHHH